MHSFFAICIVFVSSSTATHNGLAGLDFPGTCEACNITHRRLFRNNQILSSIISSIGFDPRDVAASVFDQDSEEHAYRVARFEHSQKRKRRTLSHGEDAEVPPPILDSQKMGELAADGSDAIDFPLSEQTRKADILRAELAFYARRAQSDSEYVIVRIFENVNGAKGKELGVVEEKRRDAGAYDMIFVTLRTADAARILHSSSTGFSVFVEVVSEDIEDGENLAVLPTTDGYARHKAVLSLEMIEASKKRSRRDAVVNIRGLSVCGRSYERTDQCCLYDHPVNFKDIGWTFIVAPVSYNFMACAGRCDKERDLPSAMKHDRNVVVNWRDVCCHANKFMPLYMIYVSDTGEMKSGTINGMMALSCTCV